MHYSDNAEMITEIMICLAYCVNAQEPQLQLLNMYVLSILI